MATAYLGLGANIGNREANLLRALSLLATRCRIVAVSSLYRSAALVLEDSPPGPEYLNAACEVGTDLGPEPLLAFAKEIEHAIGRRPAPRWSARPIDIDILLYDSVRLDTAALTLPHPGIAERSFVVVPLAELALGEQSSGAGPDVGSLAARIDRSGLELIAGPGWGAAAL